MLTTRPIKVVPFLPILFILLTCACQGGRPKGLAGADADTNPIQKTETPGNSSEITRTEPGRSSDTLPASYFQNTDEKNVLYPGMSLWAGGKKLALAGDGIESGARLTQEGELIVYNSGGTLWKAETKDNLPGYELIFQDDGNLVLYDRNYVAIWSSKTHPYYGGEKYRTADWIPVKLVLEPNSLVLYSATGRKVWSNKVGEIGTPE